MIVYPSRLAAVADVRCACPAGARFVVLDAFEVCPWHGAIRTRDGAPASIADARALTEATGSPWRLPPGWRRTPDGCFPTESAPSTEIGVRGKCSTCHNPRIKTPDSLSFPRGTAPSRAERDA